MDLERFVKAQEFVFASALAELGNGRKQGHWVWYILPQLKGLGRSDTAAFYGLSGLEEARAYLAHPVLGPRLRDCVSALLKHSDKSPEAILGKTDTLKFRSCLTLFAAAAPEEPLFAEALSAFYGGGPDPQTRALLAAESDLG
ncbi:MAG: DUF1810 domain-containing protein [Pseudomonadota bacterium]